MANDTDRIIHAIESSTEELKAVLADHEKRIQRLETAMTVHGLKIGAIVAALMAFAGITWEVIKDRLGLK